MGYNELQRRIPSISRTMLTKSLHEPDSDKLVVRTDRGTAPARVDYAP